MINKSENNAILIGVNTFDGDVIKGAPSFELTADGGKNLDYAVCHFDPDRQASVDEACEAAKKAAEKFKEYGMDYVANFEFQNFNREPKSADGYDWANRPDGTHLLNLPDKYVKAHASTGNLAGIMYDEFEHVIANRNLSIELGSKMKIKLNAFPLSKGKDALEQGKLLGRQLKEYADKIKANGAPALSGEHVFPILFHKFAENGITPNFKSQKESYSNIQFAVAGGAALQHKTELWNCVDLWYRLTNPGHSPEEMRHNLMFSYYCGANRVYVESCHPFEKDGKLNEYGENFIRFSKEFKGKPRKYTVADYRPEIGIIRYDDTFWGQCDPIMWKRMLFGNKNIKPDYRSREYLKAFNLITHGETCKNGISWGRISPWSIRPHRSFASMNSTAVFDENVNKETLQSLKLLFLCGLTVSENTMKAVTELVRENGLTVVTTPRFAPAEIKAKAHGSVCEIADGKGKWIVVSSYRAPGLKKRVAPFIGSKGEIRLTFEGAEVILKITEKGNAFTVVKAE